MKLIASRKIYTFILFIIVFTSFGFSVKCGKKEVKDNALLQFGIEFLNQDQLNKLNVYVTPKGATIGTITPINETAKEIVFNSVDAGLSELFATTENLAFTQSRNYSDYYILMRPPTIRSELEGHCPLLQTNNGQTIAGTVISFGTVKLEPPLIYIAENFNENAACNQLLINVVRFEGEHITAYYNDKTTFFATIGVNDIHPIYAHTATAQRRDETNEKRIANLYDTNHAIVFDNNTKETIKLTDFMKK